MISDSARYYGCVLAQLIESSDSAIRCRKLRRGIQGFYLVEEQVPIYIKFSRRRKGPWQFNFQREHQIQMKDLVTEHGCCIVALVCGNDGVVALDHNQLREVLDEQFSSQEVVSVKRKLRQMYAVSGADGRLERKVGRDSLNVTLASLLSSISSVVPDMVDADDADTS